MADDDGFAIAVSKFRSITQAEALDSELDMIPALTSYQRTLDFRQNLERRRPHLERLISRHLALPPSDFVLADECKWWGGSFNLCLPVDILPTAAPRNPPLPTQVILRIALPFRVGEDHNPGIVDEKTRCEAATYVWLQRHCPTIPIPRLLAMGFPGSQSFTAVELESGWNRVLWQLRRGWAWLYGDTLSPFHPCSRDSSLADLSYLLLEFVVQGRPLFSSWHQHRHDGRRRVNLYRSIAQVLLSLEKIPLPRIGSWTMDNRGVISLTNRPLSTLTMMWSRHKLPTSIPRNLTYASPEPFVQDMFTYQDDRMRYQPNSILSRSDGIQQLSALVGLRALLPKFWDRHSRNHPFVLTLPDLHQSNIIVDDDWNIVSVIDFESAPVQPAQMVSVPTWLSNLSPDQWEGPGLDEYKVLHDHFLEILEEEESANHQDHGFSQRLRDAWVTGRVFYNIALNSSNCYPFLFDNNISPRFLNNVHSATDREALMRLWDENCEEFLAKKAMELLQYERAIKDIFTAAKARRVDAQPEAVVENTKNERQVSVRPEVVVESIEDKSQVSERSVNEGNAGQGTMGISGRMVEVKDTTS